MCVIIVCPKGVGLPSKKVFTQAKSVNNDGFGFVSESEYFRTMDFDEFYKRLKQVDNRENLIIHMRYATHGSVKVDNCHPFYDKGLFFAHNGILNIKTKNDMTDSETAFKTKILGFAERFGFDSYSFDSSCRELACGSRFAFMKDGDIKLIGTYYEVDGVYYSNLRFMRQLCDKYYNVVNN